MFFRCCSVVVVALLLFSCNRANIGVRGGVDVPLVRSAGAGDVTQSNVDAGASYGLSFEVFTKKRNWGFRFDPQLRTSSNSMTVVSTIVGDSTIAIANAQFNTKEQFLDLPFLLTFNPLDSASDWQPFFAFGAMMSLGMELTTDVNAQRTVITNKGTETSDLGTYASGSFSGNDYYYLLYSGGIRYLMSRSFELRFETRLQQLISNSIYTIYNYDAPVLNNEFMFFPPAFVTVPSLTLGITLSVMIRM